MNLVYSVLKKKKKLQENKKKKFPNTRRKINFFLLVFFHTDIELNGSSNKVEGEKNQA